MLVKTPRRIVAYVELVYPIALVLISLGVTLMVRARFGISVASSVAYVISLAFPVFTFGTWSFIVQGFLILLLMGLIRKVKISFLMSFLVSVAFGKLVDLFSAWVAGWSELLLPRMSYYTAGILLLTLGIALFVDTGLPPNPYERFVNDLSRHLGVPFRKVKTIYDISSVAVASVFLLLFVHRLAGIGPGTVIAALANGTLIAFWLRLSVQHLSIRSFFFPGKYIRPIHMLPADTKTADES